MNYRVKVNKSGKWQRAQRAVIGISVGKNTFEGEKLQAALTWADQRFAQIILRLSDSLQAHNLLAKHPELSLDAARELARFEGDQWLARNQKYFENYLGKTIITRWDEWLHHEDFPRVHNQIIQLYNYHPKFREAVQTDTLRFVERQDKPENFERAHGHSINFILEEIAGFTLIHHAYPAAEIYPGAELSAFRIIREEKLPITPNSLHDRSLTNIGFRRVVQNPMQDEENVLGAPSSF